MASNFSFNQNFDSDDEDHQLNSRFSGRDATIVVLDCSSSMFDYSFDNGDSGGKNSLFKKCLSVLDRHLLNKIINSPKDLLGVVLYNTEKSPDPDGNMSMESPLVVPANCAILVPMRQIESDVIQYLKNMKSSEDLMDFDNKFGHSTAAKISDVLWLCSSMLSNCGKRILVPQIMWFTNEDKPHKEGSSDHQQAFQKAKDLQQLHLDLQFYPLKKAFDGDLFYKELICQLLDVSLDDYEFPTVQSDEHILLQRMFRRGFNTRALSHLIVEISDNAKFGVGVYAFTRKSVVPKPANLSRDKSEPIITKRAYKFSRIEEGDGGDVDVVSNLEANLDFSEKLEPSMTVKYQECGGEKIRFTPLEAFEIKQVMEPKIKVLGFKPVSVLSEHNFIKAPYFVYPTDTRVKNSTVFFRALWERCLAENKAVICIFTMRLKSYPRLVALVPQEQSDGLDGEVLCHDGFRMEFIPYAGDIRDLSEQFSSTNAEVDSELSSAMSKIIKKLRINYAPSMFCNPVVTNIYRQIEEQIYSEDVDDELKTDTTLANHEAQDERINDFVDHLEQLIEGFEEAAKPKRKATESLAGVSTTRKKISVDDIDEETVLQSCKEGNTKALTVAVLKAYLEKRQVRGLSSLKKDQLIQKILELAN